MAASGKKPAKSADDWLIKTSDGPTREPERETSAEEFGPGEAKPKKRTSGESIGAETEQWLVPPGAGGNGKASDRAEKPSAKAEPAKAEPAKAEPAQTETEETPAPEPPREEGLTEVVAELEARVKSLEGRVKEEARRADREAKRADEQAAKAAELAEKPEASDESGKRGDGKRLKEAKQALQQHREENAELAGRLRDLQTDLRMQAKQAKAEVAKALKERDADAKRQLQEATADAEKRMRELEADLTGQFQAREAELRGRIDELEAALAEEKKRPRAKKTAASRARKSGARSRTAAGGRAAKSTRPRRGEVKNGELELNAAKFEELRELGLSVTQSARLIAYRDVRGGYESLDELDNIPGFSKGTLADLRSRLTL